MAIVERRVEAVEETISLLAYCVAKECKVYVYIAIYLKLSCVFAL